MMPVTDPKLHRRCSTGLWLQEPITDTLPGCALRGAMGLIYDDATLAVLTLTRICRRGIRGPQ
jgi:hypothetical protein